MSVMRFSSYLRPASALALFLLLGACAGSLDQNATAAGSGSDTTSASASASGKSASASAHKPASTTELRFAPGDKLKVTVFGEEQFSGEYQVDTDGSVSLPLAGTIVVAGLSKSELERVLTNKLKTSLRNPKVTVGVASFRPFYVLGEVQKPGEYPYRSGLNVLSAIAMAGGATYRANNSVVLIQRSGKDDFTEYAQSPSVAVLPGDVVRLRERFF
jgi:protein involved in polysaccharide export with SLBB domain